MAGDDGGWDAAERGLDAPAELLLLLVSGLLLAGALFLAAGLAGALPLGEPGANAALPPALALALAFAALALAGGLLYGLHRTQRRAP